MGSRYWQVWRLKQNLLFGNSAKGKCFSSCVQFVLGAASQVKQERRKPTCHVMASHVTEVEIDDDKLFALLQSTTLPLKNAD